MTHKLSVTLETVTPEVAAHWLKLNVSHNRNLSPKRGHTMAGDMLAGKWRSHDTVEPIHFIRNPDGSESLGNAQHRLSAVVKSGTNQQFWVARNVPPEVMNVIDSGKSRNVADRLFMRGVTSQNAVASMARHVYFIERKWTNVQGALSQSDVLDAFERHRPGIDRVSAIMKNNHIFRGGRLMAVCLWLTYSDRDHGAVFVQSLVDGLGLGRTDPVYHLRERILHDPAMRNNRGASFAALLSTTFHAWSKFLKKEPVRRLGTPDVIAWPPGPYVTDAGNERKPKG